MHASGGFPYIEERANAHTYYTVFTVLQQVFDHHGWTGADGKELHETSLYNHEYSIERKPKMKPKRILRTARFIENLKKKIRMKQNMAVCSTDPEDRAKHEHDAEKLQNKVDQMERAYGQTINTAERKF